MTTALASLQGSLNPLKNVSPEDVLARYLNDETSTEIAKSFGVTKQALSYWLIERAEKEWKSAQVVKALRAKEDAEQLLGTASNALDLTRAREQLRAAQWDLERVCRRIYGNDVPANLPQAIQINIGIAPKHENSTATAQVIDKTDSAG